MTQEREKRILQWGTIAAVALAAVFFVLTFLVYEMDKVWEPFFVLFLGLAAEFGMRLILLFRVPYDNERRFVTNSGWFQKNALDKWMLSHPSNLWREDMQHYDPEAFSLAANAGDTAVQHTCVYELLCELNAVFSFLPLVFLAMADNKLVSLAVLLVICLVFCAYSVCMAARARMFRFHIKAGRV